MVMENDVKLVSDGILMYDLRKIQDQAKLESLKWNWIANYWNHTASKKENTKELLKAVPELSFLQWASPSCHTSLICGKGCATCAMNSRDKRCLDPDSEYAQWSRAVDVGDVKKAVSFAKNIFFGMRELSRIPQE